MSLREYYRMPLSKARKQWVMDWLHNLTYGTTFREVDLIIEAQKYGVRKTTVRVCLSSMVKVTFLNRETSGINPTYKMMWKGSE